MPVDAGWSEATQNGIRMLSEDSQVSKDNPHVLCTRVEYIAKNMLNILCTCLNYLHG